MTRSTLTRERIELIANFHRAMTLPPSRAEIEELARMALAAMDSEPVAEVVSIYGDPESFGEREIRPLIGIQQMPYGTKLYRHAQQPVVESEPVALQPELAKVIYHFRDWNEGFPVERFKADYVISWMLANYPPAQPAPVVSAELFHTAASAIEDLLTTKDRTGAYMWFDLPFRLRSAANAHPAPAVPDDVLAALQKVARIRLDLNDFDGDRRGIADCLCDAEEALIEVVNRRAAMLAAAPQSPGSEPATVPGKWIPVSERMPDREVDVQVYCPDKKEQMVAYLERNELEGYFRFATWRTGDGIYCQPTHWMQLPAGPQEVKGE